MYEVYVDGVLLPITPAKIQIKVGNQNKTITLIEGSEINILKSPGLQEVSFDALSLGGGCPPTPRRSCSPTLRNRKRSSFGRFSGAAV